MYSTKRPSYLFSFDENMHQIKRDYEEFGPDTQILLSSHKLAGFDSVIGNIDRNHYVACVSYYKDGKIYDTQLGITGSTLQRSQFANSEFGKPPGLPDLPTIYENLESGAVRECSEELGLFFDTRGLSNKTHSKHKTKRNQQYQDVYTYTINGRHCVPYSPEVHDESESLIHIKEEGWKDNKSEKIQIIVHGELEQMKELILQIRNRIPSNDLDSILGIRLLHQQDVYLGMKMLNKKFVSRR
jgi:hypothetical protein